MIIGGGQPVDGQQQMRKHRDRVNVTNVVAKHERVHHWQDDNRQVGDGVCEFGDERHRLIFAKQIWSHITRSNRGIPLTDEKTKSLD